MAFLVTVQAAITDELPFLRAEAESRMTARVAVMRKTGDTTIVDGLEVPEWATVYADLPFRLAGSSTGDGGTRSVTVGGVEFQEATGVGNLPADTTDLADDDLIEVASGEWAGTVLRVVEASKKDQATARRFPVVEVQRPEEWA